MPASTVTTVAGPLGRRMGIAYPADKAHKLGLRTVRDTDDLYCTLVSE